MKRPFLDTDHVASLLERQDLDVIAHDGDFLELPGKAWWICAIRTGSWKDAHLVLEWDYRGWRWNLAYLVEDQSPADIQAILPLSGTADVITRALGQAVTRKAVQPRVDAMIDTLGILPSHLGQEEGNFIAACAPRLAVDLGQMIMDATLSTGQLVALHSEDEKGGCLSCGGTTFPCSTRTELGHILRNIPGPS